MLKKKDKQNQQLQYWVMFGIINTAAVCGQSQNEGGGWGQAQVV